MKRVFSILLVALLLLVPALSAWADETAHIYIDEGLLSEAELASLEDRAQTILDTHGVGVYFLYLMDMGEITAYAEQFMANVPESDAVALFINDEYYDFESKGAIGIAVFTQTVCIETLWAAFRSVKDDNLGKLMAYYDAADQLLTDFGDTPVLQTGETESFAVPAYIARTDGGLPTLIDADHLLSDADAEALSKRLKEIGTAYRCDVVIATVPTLGGKTSEAYADDLFDYSGYGYGATPDANGMTVDGDGVLLLICMEYRDFAISTSGYAITAFTDYGIQVYLEPQFLSYLSAGSFAEAFNAFADGCDYLLKTARAGEPYDVYTASEMTANGKPIIVDQAGVLSTEQIETLSKQLRSVGDRYQTDMILVTDYGWSDGDAYAQRYYENNGYGYVADGANRGGILVYYEPNGPLGIYVAGEAKNAFAGRGLYKFRQSLLSALYGNDYSVEMLTLAFADRGEYYLAQAQSGHAINPINWIPVILFAGIGMLFAFIPVGAMKRKLKSVYTQTRADTYLVPGSFVLTQNSDVFLNSTVSRSVHVQQSSSSGGRSSGGGGFHGGSSTHTSSSGGTHGGHSGKF